MAVTTKNGDMGYSSLYRNQKKLMKSEEIFSVLGGIDELSSCLGLLHITNHAGLKKAVIIVQRDLFKLGALVAGGFLDLADTRFWEEKTLSLEDEIHRLEAKNSPLKKFICPGGTRESSVLHLARSVCRRAEREFVSYSQHSNKKSLIKATKYLNRLSDYLFVLARYYNKKGRDDIIYT